MFTTWSDAARLPRIRRHATRSSSASSLDILLVRPWPEAAECSGPVGAAGGSRGQAGTRCCVPTRTGPPALDPLTAAWKNRGIRHEGGNRDWPTRRLRSLVVGCALVVTSAPEFVSASDSDAGSFPWDVVGPVIDGGYVEQPEKGFAITFPDDWTVRQVTPDGALALGDDGDATPGANEFVVSATSPDESAWCYVTFDDPAVTGLPALLATFASEADTEPEALGIGDYTRAHVDLPIGPAWREDFVVEGVLPVTIHMARGPIGLYALACYALEGDPPDDGWRSIAETFEFLPDPTTGLVPVSPVLGGGRIERPDLGFAVTVPVDWTVEAGRCPELTPRCIRIWRTVAGPHHDHPTGHRHVRRVQRPGHHPARGGATGLPLSVRQATKAFLAGWRDDAEFQDGFLCVFDLPAGRTGHVSATTVVGRSGDAYLYADDGRWLSLECWSSDPPARSAGCRSRRPSSSWQ